MVIWVHWLGVERIVPVRKDAAVGFDLPAQKELDNIPDVMASLLTAVSKGDVETYRRCVETSELEQRFAQLEGLHEP
jgi:hypothetical protein